MVRDGDVSLGGLTSTNPSVLSLFATVSAISTGDSSPLNTTGLIGERGVCSTISVGDIPRVFTNSERLGRCNAGSGVFCLRALGTGSGLTEHGGGSTGDNWGGGVGSGRGYVLTGLAEGVTGVDGEGIRGRGRDIRFWSLVAMDDCEECAERIEPVEGPAWALE